MPEPRLIGLNGLERHMMKTGGPLTPDQWTTSNPILDYGQIGIEVDPDTGEWGKAKIGDGDTEWNDLAYFDPAGAVAGVKKYVALLTQSGTDAPVATVLENTIGAIVWARSGEGAYTATLTGAFPEDKVFIMPSRLAALNSGDVAIQMTCNKEDANVIAVSTVTFPDGNTAEMGLNDFSIEILVYP